MTRLPGTSAAPGAAPHPEVRPWGRAHGPDGAGIEQRADDLQRDLRALVVDVEPRLLGLVRDAQLVVDVALDAEPGGLDLVSLGALVHRLDPGVIPFRKATECAIHVSGGEFNVAANLADAFGRWA